MIEIQGQNSRDYGRTLRVIERDATGNIARSIGGLSEADAEAVATEWCDGTRLGGCQCGNCRAWARNHPDEPEHSSGLYDGLMAGLGL